MDYVSWDQCTSGDCVDPDSDYLVMNVWYLLKWGPMQ